MTGVGSRGRAARTGAADGRDTLRERIRQVATDVFMREGYHGTSFLLIAKELGTTHSHIHYYFKTKAALAEAVVEHYVAEMLAAYRAIWDDRGSDLFSKFVATRDWAWLRYRHHNPTGAGAAHWGLLHRFTNDTDALSPGVKALMRTTTQELEELIGRGIATSIAAGELAPSASREDLVLLVSTLLYSSRQATRYEGSFDRLDRLFRTTCEIVHHAHGTRTGLPDWPAPAGRDARPPHGIRS